MTDEELDRLTATYRSRGLLIDSNLFIVYLVGCYDNALLKRCQATKNFSVADFQLLAALVQRFDKIATTPHILTEISNLSGRLPDSVHADFMRRFSAVIFELDEKSVDAVTIARNVGFVRLGLTDAGIDEVAKGRYLILTNDLDLYLFVSRRGIDALNFNHLRDALTIH